MREFLHEETLFDGKTENLLVCEVNPATINIYPFKIDLKPFILNQKK